MKQLLAAAALVLSFLSAQQVDAASPVSATLTLPNNSVLPGVPFDLVVTYKNVSDKPITIGGARATLIVKFANDNTMVMDKHEGLNQWDLQFSPPVRLPPGESTQQAASWENGHIPNWFREGSFSGPGTYGIALDLRIVDQDEDPLGSIRTQPVTLTRIDPVGIDAELWKRMQQMSEGGRRWSDNSFVTRVGYDLATEIIQLHPDSGYYPYVLALRALGSGVDKNHIPALLEAAERFPTSPAYPYLLNAAAACSQWGGVQAERQRNMEEAKKYFTLAESKYREALNTKSVAIRATSKAGLWDVARGLDRTSKQKVR